MFMIPEGGPGLLKAVCAVCLDLNAAAAFRSHTCRTYSTSESQRSQKQPQGVFAETVDIDKHMGRGGA